MSDPGKRLVNLFQSAALLFLGTIVGNGLALLGETFIVRSLPPAEYGHLALAYTIVMLSAQIATFGVKDGVTRLLSAENDGSARRDLLQHGFLIVCVTGVAAVVTLLLSREFLASIMDDTQLPYFLVLFSPFLVLYPVSRVSLGILRAEGLSGPAVLARDVAGRAVPIVLFLVLMTFVGSTLAAVAFWLAFPVALTLVASYFILNRFPARGFVQFNPNRSTFTRLWSFSWPLAVSASIFIFLSNMDVLMIGYFLDSDQVGYYRAIQPLRRAATLLMSSFTFLFLPTATMYFEENNMIELDEFYTVSTKWIVLGTFPIVLIFGLFSDDVVRTFFDVDYLPAASALTILVLGLFFRAVVGLDGDMTKAIDRPKIELYSALLGVLANFFLNALLIPIYGINGAAVATASGFFVYNSVEVAVIYRLTGIHPFALSNFKPLVPTLAVAIVLWETTSSAQFGLAGLVGLGVLLTVVQLASVLITKSLEPADMVLVKKIEGETGIRLDWLETWL